MGWEPRQFSRYRRKYPELARPYLVPGYPWTPLVFVGAAFALVLNVVLATPRNAGIGLGIVGLGIPAYLMWKARNKDEQPAAGTAME